MFLKSHSHLEEKGVNWYVFLSSENFQYSSERNGERICMGRGERTKKKKKKNEMKERNRTSKQTRMHASRDGEN